MHDIPATPGGMPATPGGMPLLTAEQVADYRETFNLYDKNGDAKIDQAELAVLFKGLNIHLTAEEVADLMKAVDQDESGSIDFPEFCRMMVLHLGKSEEEELHEVFDKLETFLPEGPAKKGEFGVEELQTIMLALGERLTDEDAKAIMAAGHDNKHALTFKGFHRVLKNKPPAASAAVAK